MKSLSLVVFWIALASCLFAQTEVVVKKNKASEKVVSVDVNKTGEGERTVKIVTEEGGEKKVIEWTDHGEIPDDIKKQLEEDDIHINIIDGSDSESITIDVHGDIEIDGDDVRKEVIVIRKSDDGEEMKIEWDGEGEMPSEMKELLEEHNLEIGELHERHSEGKRHKIKIRIAKDKHKKMRQRAMKEGHRRNTKEKREYKIVTKDEDGNDKVIEWYGDGRMHEGLEEHLDNEHVFFLGGKGEGGNSFFFSDDEEVHLSDAYMGAQVGNADNGAQILEILKDSPADKAGLQKGDIVQRINGARARNMEGLLSILNHFDPDDEVELLVLRDGSEKKIKMTLGQRPDSFR